LTKVERCAEEVHDVCYSERLKVHEREWDAMDWYSILSDLIWLHVKLFVLLCVAFTLVVVGYRAFLGLPPIRPRAKNLTGPLVEDQLIFSWGDWYFNVLVRPYWDWGPRA
jgi:hypothetical protein